MPRIRRLDPHVVNKIAAGEVIERPASVVKELLENSIDALASRIEVDVAVGGTELIRVVDDGEGVSAEDLPLAVCSHATSKISEADDLFRVQTMGFRGEALASIASVSRFRLRSRTAESDTGHELLVDAGAVGDVKPCGCPPGTLVEIRQLFANTPVRRKFLRTASTEFGHIGEQFTRIALARPRLHAVLRHNDRTVYELPASADALERLRVFFGDELAAKLIPVESESGDVRLWGYVGHPSVSKSTRKGQYLFLNGRWITDRSLQHALGEAYRGILMVGRQPLAFLFMEMPADQVDVNVHPTKAEVRFRDGQKLYRQLLSTLRTRFLGMDLDSTMNLQAPAAQPQSAATPEQQRELEMQFVAWAKDELAAWQPTERIGAVAQSSTANEHNIAVDAAFGAGDAIATPHRPETESSTDRPEPGSGLPTAFPAAPSPHFAAGRVEHHTAAGARVMQIHDCYLVVETGDGLTVIDQHALHERVLYEQLRRRVLDGAVETQRLLVPETIELNADEAAGILEHAGLLTELGLAVEDFGGGTVLLSAFPPMLGRADRVQLLRDIAEKLLEAGPAPTRRDLLDSLLHTMSCRGAIKAGQRLAPAEMESLLAERHLIDDAHHCPHGRPTALLLSRKELDRQFGRLG